MILSFGDPVGNATELVKYHVFRARDHLVKLVEIAGDDPEIKKAVADFHLECLTNIMGVVLGSARKLENDPKRLAELFRLPQLPGTTEVSVGTQEETDDPVENLSTV